MSGVDRKLAFRHVRVAFAAAFFQSLPRNLLGDNVLSQRQGRVELSLFQSRLQQIAKVDCSGGGRGVMAMSAAV